MLVSKNLNSLVFTPKYFYCFEGNVGNMAVTRKRSHRQRVSICHFVSYIMYFYKIIVYRNSVGGRGGSMAGLRSICSRAMVASLHYVQISDATLETYLRSCASREDSDHPVLSHISLWMNRLI